MRDSWCFVRLLAVLIAGLAGWPGVIAAQSLNARDGSDQAPRLWLVQNLWGFRQWPAVEQEWSVDEQLEKLRQTEFDAFDVALPDDAAEPGVIAHWRALAAKYGLGIGVEAFPERVEDLDAALPFIKGVQAPYVDLHVGGYFMAEGDAEALLRSLVERCKSEGIPMMTQTHRGRVTQDLLRTVRYANAIPDLRFALDVSHYVVAGELTGELSPEARGAFDVLVRRTAMLDGRVSNGEQVQIDIGSGGDTPHAKRFAALWKQAMIAWLQSAVPGDLFIFRVELGPPDYAIRDLSGREISDRWAQALVIRDLAERLWNEAVRETGKGELHASGARGGDR
ncbi:MAG: sugar phosphate isomerase/epimerase [Luteitalea sp.]|nr:sugar phosphate isomerase/epimerase [Luteitalea sp.]